MRIAGRIFFGHGPTLQAILARMPSVSPATGLSWPVDLQDTTAKPAWYRPSLAPQLEPVNSLGHVTYLSQPTQSLLSS